MFIRKIQNHIRHQNESSLKSIPLRYINGVSQKFSCLKALPLSAKEMSSRKLLRACLKGTGVTGCHITWKSVAQLGKSREVPPPFFFLTFPKAFFGNHFISSCTVDWWLQVSCGAGFYKASSAKHSSRREENRLLSVVDFEVGSTPLGSHAPQGFSRPSTRVRITAMSFSTHQGSKTCPHPFIPKCTSFSLNSQAGNRAANRGDHFSSLLRANVVMCVSVTRVGNGLNIIRPKVSLNMKNDPKHRFCLCKWTEEADVSLYVGGRGPWVQQRSLTQKQVNGSKIRTRSRNMGSRKGKV